MRKQKYYTIGEILRLGLMKSRSGEPYKDKASILRRVRKMAYRRIASPHGEAYAVSMGEIKKHNAKVAR